MKTKFKVVLAMLLVVPMALVFFACAKEHNYSEEWTCSETHHWHACVDEGCDDVKDKAEHTAGDWIVDTNATCATEGSRHKECTVCHYTVETEAIAKLNHDLHWVSDANEHWQVCDNCDYVGDKTNHSFVNHICSVCKAEETHQVTSAEEIASLFARDVEPGRIILANDIVLTDTITFAHVGWDVTLDLNGKTIITSDNAEKDSAASTAFFINGGTLEVVNGTISTMRDAFNVQGHDGGVGEGEAKDKTYTTIETTLKLGSDLTVISSNTKSSGKQYDAGKVGNGGNCVYIIGAGANLITSANLITYSAYTVIQGNGNSYNKSNSVTINGGTISHENGDIAIYLPNTATTTITAGTIKGATALYTKAGTLNITGGNFIATGKKANYEYYGNGCIATGDAVVVDACGYPGGNINVSITGGLFTTEDPEAYQVGYYKYNGNTADSFSCTANGVTYHEEAVSA